MTERQERAEEELKLAEARDEADRELAEAKEHYRRASDLPPAFTPAKPPRALWLLLLIAALGGVLAAFLTYAESQASSRDRTAAVERNRQLLEELAKQERANGDDVEEHRVRNELLHECIVELILDVVEWSRTGRLTTITNPCPPSPEVLAGRPGRFQGQDPPPMPEAAEDEEEGDDADQASSSRPRRRPSSTTTTTTRSTTTTTRPPSSTTTTTEPPCRIRIPGDGCVVP